MSSTWNNDLISRLEAIDLAFTGYWSKFITLRCGSFYFNQDLPNDVFFNKMTNISCIDDETLRESLLLFKKNHTIPYFYVLNRPDLEEKLLKKNFRIYDSQHVLIKAPNNGEAQQALKISSKDAANWSKIFCDAYDCNDWLNSVVALVQNSSDFIEYYVDKSMSSCVALCEAKSMLGLYCLGTVPEMRHKGRVHR